MRSGDDHFNLLITNIYCVFSRFCEIYFSRLINIKRFDASIVEYYRIIMGHIFRFGNIFESLILLP